MDPAASKVHVGRHTCTGDAFRRQWQRKSGLPVDMHACSQLIFAQPQPRRHLWASFPLPHVHFRLISEHSLLHSSTRSGVTTGLGGGGGGTGRLEDRAFDARSGCFDILEDDQAKVELKAEAAGA